MVNGGIYPVETNKGWKMGEVVDYLTDTTAVAYTTTFFVVINKDAWAALPPEAQKAMTAVSADWIPATDRPGTRVTRKGWISSWLSPVMLS